MMDIRRMFSEFYKYQSQNYKRTGVLTRITQIITSLIIMYLYSQFAKIIWPHDIKNEGMIFFLFSILVHNCSFIFSNSIFFIFYKYKLFLNYKVDKNPWPWEQNYEEWNIQLHKTIKTLLLNHLLISPALSLPFFINNTAPFRMDYESLPSFFEILWQYIFINICDDFLFYWSHRFLHWDKIYGYIHKQHHEYISTIGITAEYAHPIEYIFGNIIPANLGTFLLGKRVHAFTALLKIWLKILVTTESHSGYSFPWSPCYLNLEQVPTDFHNYHHLNYKGNYGNTMLWDIICNTVNDSFKKNLKEESKSE